MRNKFIVYVTILATICSGICCFEGILFGDFSTASNIVSSVMFVMWIVAIIYLAKTYNGNDIQKYFFSILLAMTFVAEVGLLLSDNDYSNIYLLFLVPMCVLSGFVDFIKDQVNIGESEIYICITFVLLMVNLSSCLVYSPKRKSTL